MVISQAFLAMLAGLAVTITIDLVITVLLRRLAPEWVGTKRRPPPGYLFVHLGYTFLAGAAGGYVAAWAAGFNPLREILGLAIVVLVLGAISALQERSRQPLSYQLMLLVVSPVGVVAGGLLRLRVVGVL